MSVVNGLSGAIAWPKTAQKIQKPSSTAPARNVFEREADGCARGGPSSPRPAPPPQLYDRGPLGERTCSSGVLMVRLPAGCAG